MKVYTWQEIYEKNIYVRCPEKWMREQVLDYALNVVGDGIWEYYKDTIHNSQERSIFYITHSSSQRAKNGVELMISDLYDYGDAPATIEYEQSECYQIYNEIQLDIDSFESMLLED